MTTRGQDLPTPQAHTRPHMAGDSVTHTLPIPGAAPPPPSGGGRCSQAHPSNGHQCFPGEAGRFGGGTDLRVNSSSATDKPGTGLGQDLGTAQATVSPPVKWGQFQGSCAGAKVGPGLSSFCEDS